MDVEFKISEGSVDYTQAVEFMEDRVQKIISGEEKELIWLCQHPPIYTAGISAKDEDLINEDQIPVHKTNRGGQYTYHGPGIRIIYVLLNLKNVFALGKPDVSEFVKMLENWIINVLAEIGIKGEIRKDRVGIWVKYGNTEKKIAAIGIKLKKWVSYHGIAINIEPDLKNFGGIVPCGIKEFGVTSVEDLGEKVTFIQIDQILKRKFLKIFDNYSE